MLIKIVEDFITEEDANVLINEMKRPSEINEYPSYYKDRNGGTAFPYNKTVMSLLKKYAVDSNKIQKEFFTLENDVIITNPKRRLVIDNENGEQIKLKIKDGKFEIKFQDKKIIISNGTFELKNKQQQKHGYWI
jgi:hypothetical protein